MTKEERAKEYIKTNIIFKPGTLPTQNLVNLWLAGYESARSDFSKDDGYITKEYFRGYDAAMENMKAFVFNVTRDDPDASFKIKGETEIYLFSHQVDRNTEEISIRDAFTRYLNSVQENYNRLKRQLGGK